MEAVGERFAAYGLEVHPEKTRLLEFGRFAIADRAKRGEGRPETFDFLGFTHYYCRTQRNGRFRARAQAGGEANAPHAAGPSRPSCGNACTRTRR